MLSPTAPMLIGLSPLLNSASEWPDESPSSFPNDLTPPDNLAYDLENIPYTTEQARAGLKGKRVVVIEDEGVTQMQLRRTLTHAGLIVAGTAINGRDGVEVALRECPDLILLDIRMPVMDGVEAARQIMASMPVCIVMLTAFSDDEYRDKTRAIGVSGYVIKPITSDLLLPLMLQALDVFMQRQQESE